MTDRDSRTHKLEWFYHRCFAEALHVPVAEKQEKLSPANNYVYNVSFVFSS